MSSIEVRQKSPMEEADSGESGPHRDPEHPEEHAQRNRDSPGSREGSLPAGAKLTEEEQRQGGNQPVNRTARSRGLKTLPSGSQATTRSWRRR